MSFTVKLTSQHIKNHHQILGEKTAVDLKITTIKTEIKIGNKSWRNVLTAWNVDIKSCSTNTHTLDLSSGSAGSPHQALSSPLSVCRGVGRTGGRSSVPEQAERKLFGLKDLLRSHWPPGIEVKQ